jgi:hypothetical protein
LVWGVGGKVVVAAARFRTSACPRAVRWGSEDVARNT